MITPFDRIHERDRRTDRRMDGRTLLMHSIAWQNTINYETSLKIPIT